MAYTALDYRYRLSDYADIAQEMSVEYTDANTTGRSLTALTARLNARLSLRLSYEVKHNSQPPEDASERTDHRADGGAGLLAGPTPPRRRPTGCS